MGEDGTNTEDEDVADDEAGELFDFNWFFRKILLTIHFISSFECRRGGGGQRTQEETGGMMVEVVVR